METSVDGDGDFKTLGSTLTWQVETRPFSITATLRAPDGACIEDSVHLYYFFFFYVFFTSLLFLSARILVFVIN